LVIIGEEEKTKKQGILNSKTFVGMQIRCLPITLKKINKLLQTKDILKPRQLFYTMPNTWQI
jgi:hypothetical protein